MGASQDITCVALSGPIVQDYLCRVLVRMSPFIQKKSRGTTIQGITRDDVAALSILLPPPNERQLIAKVPDAVDAAVERTRAERAMLQLLKASAAEALLTGRVRVRDWGP